MPGPDVNEWKCPFCGKINYRDTDVACSCDHFIENVIRPQQVFEKEIDYRPSSNKTLVVNIFGGPCSGKSTMAAGIFYDLKREHIECELALEVAKEYLWERREFTFDDQIYLFAKQYHRLFRLFGQVQVIITDCPILLSVVYDKEQRPTFEQLIVEEHNKMWTYNVYLHRIQPYNTKGRVATHTEYKAKEIDRNIASVLDKHNIPFEVFDGNEEGKTGIVKKIRLLIK